MKKIVLLILSISLFSFIDNNTRFDSPNYFEGQITYEIEYTPYDKNVPSEKIAELIGSKMILTFKEGNFKKQYFSPNGELLQERILNLKDKKSYLKTNDSDTIYWFNITKNDSKTSFEVLPDSILYNHPSTIIQTKTTFSGMSFKEKPIEVTALYGYAKDLLINPDWYNNYNEGNFNEIIRSGKGIAISTVNRGLYWEQRIKVKSINKRKVKKSELKVKLKKDSPLKEL